MLVKPLLTGQLFKRDDSSLENQVVSPINNKAAASHVATHR